MKARKSCMANRDSGSPVRDPLEETGDGSFTVRHPVLNESYHAREGARSEAEVKFIRPTRLRERLRQGPVRLLDIGFGLGINCRAALACAEGAVLHIDTLELEPEALERGLIVSPDDPLILSLLRSGQFEGVQLHPGDLRQTLQHLPGPYDVIFHDPFSPLKNTEAWTVEVFRLLKENAAPDGLLATYSESTLVRSALAEAGWQVGASEAVPPHRGGTVAALDKQKLEHPLDPVAFHAEPYRDPGLNRNGKQIRSQREAVVRLSRS